MKMEESGGDLGGGIEGVGIELRWGADISMDNGLGDRITMTENSATTQFTVDLNRGLTQVLQDGTRTYQHGGGRIAQHTSTTAEYFLTDASPKARPEGSRVRAADEGCKWVCVASSASYRPFGEELSSQGTAVNRYGYTGTQKAGYR